jgi:hypothetical protein
LEAGAKSQGDTAELASGMPSDAVPIDIGQIFSLSMISAISRA